MPFDYRMPPETLRRMAWEEQLTDFERWDIATGRPRRMPEDWEPETTNEEESDGL